MDAIEKFFSEKNFEKTRRFAQSQYSPEPLRALLAKLGNPQHSYKTIHVVGSVGKGSVSECLSRFAGQNGLLAGRYSSPHVVDWRERITVGEEWIEESEFTAIWQRMKQEEETENLSFFDALTLIAFIYFQEKKIDLAVVEAGLGGRFDSTNNLLPGPVVITRIARDHENILGNTLAKIAYEKAGVIQGGAKVYSIEQEREVADVFRNEVESRESELVFYPREGKNYREENCAFARKVAESEFGWSSDCKQCGLPGRLETVQSNPRVIYDSAHNGDAAAALARYLNGEGNRVIHFYINTLKERELTTLVNELKQVRTETHFYLYPPVSEYFYTSMEITVPLSFEELSSKLQEKNILHVVTGSTRLRKSLIESLQSAKQEKENA